MKTQSISRFTQISTEQLGNLTTIINETLATGVALTKNKIFTAANLWNIQRQGKGRIQRRTIA